MKLIKLFEDYINENNRSNVYHITTFQSLENILISDSLRPQNNYKWKNGKFYYGISTTRDKQFKIGGNSVTLELNLNKLKQNYKILPEDYLNKFTQSYSPKSDPNRSEKTKEFEEFIITKEKGIILSKYLVSIEISENLFKEIEKDLDDYITTSIGSEYLHGLKFWLNNSYLRFENLIVYCKKYNVPIKPSIEYIENFNNKLIEILNSK